ncbi:uncharacterized protein [Montipora capricornis]|uniref:uncharacterized protein isoform X2 n=1 Tax=Montipora capricornis TaxID=246305 RepID=UPI0035F114C7
MKLMGIVIAITWCITQTTSAPYSPGNSSTASAMDTENLIKLLVVPRVINATAQMKLFYPFISSSSLLQDPLITLGLAQSEACTQNQLIQDKLKILHSKMAVFMAPLHLTSSFEDSQGPSHRSLASVLEDLSYFLNGTVMYIEQKMVSRGFTVPGVTTIPESNLNGQTRGYLTALVQNNLVTITVTSGVVKTYRNYVIVRTLYDVINEASSCF